MRIHNIIKTVCLAGSLALLSACEDWLEIEPKDRFWRYNGLGIGRKCRYVSE